MNTGRGKKSRRKIERDNGKCKYFVLPLGIFLSSHDFNFRGEKKSGFGIWYIAARLETTQKTNRWYYTLQRGAIKVAACRRDQVKRYVSSIERQDPPFVEHTGTILNFEHYAILKKCWPNLDASHFKYICKCCLDGRLGQAK